MIERPEEQSGVEGVVAEVEMPRIARVCNEGAVATGTLHLLLAGIDQHDVVPSGSELRGVGPRLM